MRANSLLPIQERYAINAMLSASTWCQDSVAVVPNQVATTKLVWTDRSVCMFRFAVSAQRRTDELPIRAIVSDAALFQDLVRRWHSERAATSSTTQMAMCRSYQRIIGMGRPVAVPLILKDLAGNRDNPDHWFWALQALTGEDPVPEDARGDMRQMARVWQDWGQRNGYAG